MKTWFLKNCFFANGVSLCRYVEVGTALLGQGRWAEAHRAWRRGVAAAPLHPALSAQAAKDAAYLPGVVVAPPASAPPAGAAAPPPPPFETLHPAGVWSTEAGAAPPLLDEAECAEWVAAAEAAAAARGGAAYKLNPVVTNP